MNTASLARPMYKRIKMLKNWTCGKARVIAAFQINLRTTNLTDLCDKACVPAWEPIWGKDSWMLYSILIFIKIVSIGAAMAKTVCRNKRPLWRERKSRGTRNRETSWNSRPGRTCRCYIAWERATGKMCHWAPRWRGCWGVLGGLTPKNFQEFKFFYWIFSLYMLFRTQKKWFGWKNFQILHYYM